VAVIPASAATEDGRILTVSPDHRLRERRATILRRQGNQLVITEPPEAPVVAVRKPQLGPGVKVKVIEPAPARSTADLVSLSADRRARLLNVVQADPELPETEKARLLDRLSSGEAPRALVERLEAGAVGAASGG
jgi:hypothetical protein